MRTLASLLALLLIPACSWPDMRDPETATLRGTATYRERIALPPDAVLVVRLEDVSPQNEEVKVLAEQEVAAEGRQVPLPFELRYEPADIITTHRYAVRAEIRADGAVMWSSDRAAPVFAQGAVTEMELLMTRVRTATPDTVAMPLRGTTWLLATIGGEAVQATQGEDGAHLILDPEEPRYAGSGGVNRILGGVTVNGAKITFQAGPATLMAGPPELMAQERSFVEALGRVDGYEIARDRLTLTADGAPLLAFTAAP